MNQNKTNIKRNRFDAVGQSLIFAAGVIIAVVFVSIMIMEFENSRKLSDAVNENMLELTASVKDSAVMMYDGVRVSGADVLNFGKKFFYSAVDDAPFVMQVTSLSGISFEVTSKAEMEAAVRSSGIGTDPFAIDPAADYLGFVTSNENGIITHVSFTCVSQE